MPHFVPREEREYNLKWARDMRENKWIPEIWNWKKNHRDELTAGDGEEVGRICQRDHPLILDICSGPAGGFVPAVLLLGDYDARVMLSDLSPTVVREWRNFLRALDNPPPHAEYAAFDVHEVPFADESIDVVTGYSAIINIEGGEHAKGLSEVHRVLKKGGLFVMSDQAVTEECRESLPAWQREQLMGRYPNIFTDFQEELQNLGYESVETAVKGTWSNKNDQSTLADLVRGWGTELIFSQYTKYCVK